MSGWDASSRPGWDPQGEGGENTQAFGVPDFPEAADDPWAQPGAAPAPPGYPQRADSHFPGSAPPGTPPDIFLQDYDRNDFAPNNFGPNGLAPNGLAPNGFASDGFRGQDPGQWDRADRGYGRQDDFGRQDAGRQNAGDFGRQAPGQQAPDPQDFGRQDGGRQDFGRQDGRRGNGRHAGAQPDLPQRDRGQFDQGPWDRLGAPPGYPDHEQAAGYPDHEQAARMDPALRDFFAPPPARPDAAPQGYGQQRYGGYERTDPQGRRAAQDGPWGQERAPRQPGAPAHAAPPAGWNPPVPRPGSRSAHRPQSHSGGSRRPRLMALIAVGAVVVVGIAVGAFVLLDHGNSGSQTPAGTTASPTVSASATSSPPAKAPAAKTVAYTLTTPAVAGGYQKLATIPAAVQTASGPVSQAIESAAKSAGGKVSGQVAAAYQLSDGQVLAFTGFEGTFNLAKIMASLSSLAADSHTYAAGAHGGLLGCATAPGTPSGTVCFWGTATTLGITEFFSPDGPEVVTSQAKAASDTLNVRNSVEVPK